MILTIDIGNSNIVFAAYDSMKQRVYDARYETLKLGTVDQFKVYLEPLVNPILQVGSIEDFILSCVVPAITDQVLSALRDLLKVPGMNCTVDSAPDLEILLRNPREIGADLIATTIGAKQRFKQPVIIVDMGSATKITVVNPKGQFAGGLLLPGLKVSQDAMNQFIPHLPVIPLKMPFELLGLDTVSAMQSGLMYSTIDAVIGISNRIEAELLSPCTRVLTGGLANAVLSGLPQFQFEPFLLNEGLLAIYLLNASKKSLL